MTDLLTYLSNVPKLTPITLIRSGLLLNVKSKAEDPDLLNFFFFSQHNIFLCFETLHIEAILNLDLCLCSNTTTSS